MPFNNENATIGDVRSLNDAAAQASTWPLLDAEERQAFIQSDEIVTLLACMGAPPTELDEDDAALPASSTESAPT